jgi:hypothetical protein
VSPVGAPDRRVTPDCAGYARRRQPEMPNSAARSAACCRVSTPSLPRIADT